MVEETKKNIETSCTVENKKLQGQTKHPTPVHSHMHNLGVKFECQ